MRRSIMTAAGAALLVAMAAVACGGGSSSSPSTPTAPTTPPSTGGGNPTLATITIGTDGKVTPTSVTIAPGGRVEFINNHSRNHEMSSDPHPEHSDCPDINQVGFLVPGQKKQTGNLNVVRTCGFHDHGEPSNRDLQGRITIQ